MPKGSMWGQSRVLSYFRLCIRHVPSVFLTMHSELAVFRCVAIQVVNCQQLVIYGQAVRLVILYAGV